MVDQVSLRESVGIIVLNHHKQVLWAERSDIADAWQFPQGGIDQGEMPQQAMYRELKEELGLCKDHVELLAMTPRWLTYYFPKLFCYYQTECAGPTIFSGQKQQWFLLKLLVDESAIQLNFSLEPEFKQWRWVNYWYPLEHVVTFKRGVYRQALNHLAGYAGITSHQGCPC